MVVIAWWTRRGESGKFRLNMVARRNRSQIVSCYEGHPRTNLASSHHLWMGLVDDVDGLSSISVLTGASGVA